MFVRVAGEAVRGHSIPVSVAAQVLHHLQGAITAIGSALVGSEGTARPQEGIRKATEFLITPDIAAGSIVFRLERVPNPPAQGALIEEETLADRATHHLIEIFRSASADDAAEVGDLTEKLRPLGARTASNVSKLVDELAARQMVLNVGQSTTLGIRRKAQLNERGCAALRDAVDRNREQVTELTLEGVLNTASDGSDKVRITLASGEQIRPTCDPLVGMALGQWLGTKVVAQVRRRATWRLATGAESLSWELLDASPLEPETGRSDI